MMHKHDMEQNASRREDAAFLPVLALAPLLPVASSASSALALGLTITVVLTLSSLCLAALRLQSSPGLRLTAILMLAATFTTCAGLLLEAFAYELHRTLGIFLPLLACSCVLLFHSMKYPAGSMLMAIRKPVKTSLAAALALLIAGTLRELLGNVSFQVALLPAGAFLCAGLLLALKNAIDARHRPQEPTAVPPTGSRRVRITGKI